MSQLGLTLAGLRISKKSASMPNNQDSILITMGAVRNDGSIVPSPPPGFVNHRIHQGGFTHGTAFRHLGFFSEGFNQPNFNLELFGGDVSGYRTLSIEFYANNQLSDRDDFADDLLSLRDAGSIPIGIGQSPMFQSGNRSTYTGRTSTGAEGFVLEGDNKELGWDIWLTWSLH